MSAQARATFWIAMIAFGAVTVLSPYVLLADLMPDRTRLVYAGVSAVVWALYCAWMAQRQRSRIAERPAPARELSLASEHAPAAVWLAAGPPIVVALLLWALVAYASELPWHHTAIGPAARFRMLPVALIFWNGLAAQGVVFGLGAWHSMSRSYEFRRTLLLTSIGNQWLLLILSTAFVADTFLRLPGELEPVFVVVIGVATPILAWNVWRISRVYHANPRLGKWVYLDVQDPSFVSHRGVNMASGWFWGMAGIVILQVALVRWILPQMQI